MSKKRPQVLPSLTFWHIGLDQPIGINKAPLQLTENIPVTESLEQRIQPKSFKSKELA